MSFIIIAMANLSASTMESHQLHSNALNNFMELKKKRKKAQESSIDFSQVEIKAVRLSTQNRFKKANSTNHQIHMHGQIIIAFGQEN